MFIDHIAGNLCNSIYGTQKKALIAFVFAKFFLAFLFFLARV